MFCTFVFVVLLLQCCFSRLVVNPSVLRNYEDTNSQILQCHEFVLPESRDVIGHVIIGLRICQTYWWRIMRLSCTVMNRKGSMLRLVHVKDNNVIPGRVC